MTNNELIANWHFKREGPCPVNFDPENDIAMWYGDGGLVTEIFKSTYLWRKFVSCLIEDMCCNADGYIGDLPRLQIATACLIATAYELTVAFVKTLKDQP